MKKVYITLELDQKAVDLIEKTAEDNIKYILENEINKSPDCFIEMLGLGNY